MKIIPIGCSSIAWELFVKECNNYIGRSPTRSLDKNNLPVGSIDSFLAALDEFRLKDSNPREGNIFTLNHIMLSFLMILDRWTYYSLLENSFRNIDIIKTLDNQEKIVIIASGTLKNWREAILNCDSEWSKYMWDLMHSMGFGRFFKEYKINNNIIERR